MNIGLRHSIQIQASMEELFQQSIRYSIAFQVRYAILEPVERHNFDNLYQPIVDNIEYEGGRNEPLD